MWEKSLVVGNSFLLLFLLLTGSHNLLNYAIICLVDTEKRIITTPRKYPKNTAFPGNLGSLITMIKVLFICHGNICRSPMAEFILKKKVSDLGVADRFYIASAATSTEEIWHGVGNPVYPPAKAELAKHGISCEGKRAVQLKASDYNDYEFLIGMDAMNIRNIERMTGHQGGKIRLLLSFCGRNESITDPWYSSRFDDTYRDVDEGCDAFLEYLRENKLL